MGSTVEWYKSSHCCQPGWFSAKKNLFPSLTKSAEKTPASTYAFSVEKRVWWVADLATAAAGPDIRLPFTICGFGLPTAMNGKLCSKDSSKKNKARKGKIVNGCFAAFKFSTVQHQKSFNWLSGPKTSTNVYSWRIVKYKFQINQEHLPICRKVSLFEKTGKFHHLVVFDLFLL